MTDPEIIGLYWARDEEAIRATDKAYGGYCRSIAWNILKNRQDTEECVNDTWLRAWNAMPPKKPDILSVFLGTITRNLSLDRWRGAMAKKRGGGQLRWALDELEACVPAEVSLEDRIARTELTRLLDRFLQSLNQKDRCILVAHRAFGNAADRRGECTAHSFKHAVVHEQLGAHGVLGRGKFQKHVVRCKIHAAVFGKGLRHLSLKEGKQAFLFVNAGAHALKFCQKAACRISAHCVSGGVFQHSKSSSSSLVSRSTANVSSRSTSAANNDSSTHFKSS